MKIQINFDLLSKIKEANTGLSLKRTVSKILISTLLTTALTMPLETNDNYNSNVPITNILIILGVQIFYTIKSNKLFADKYKEIAINDLNKFLYSIKTLNVSINYEDLLNSYTYCTEYEEYPDNGIIPKIVQKKYFIIPINEEKEISLIQEHIIGTNIYDISCGTKQKKLKLVTQTT